MLQVQTTHPRNNKMSSMPHHPKAGQRSYVIPNEYSFYAQRLQRRQQNPVHHTEAVNYNISEIACFLEEEEYFRTLFPEKVAAKQQQLAEELHAQNLKDDGNRALIAAHVARTQNMCPLNQFFSDTGQYSDITKHGIEGDMINFVGRNNVACVGFFSQVVGDNRAMVLMRKLNPVSDNDLYFDGVKADTFLGSWTYRFPQLR